jgi:N-acetylgalactosamine kinase
MKRPFVTVILAGGKGTRMGSSDKHKVCFEVLGVPVILRALETYNLCGSRLNVVVVGMMAEKVMATINARYPGTVYAFQEQPLGTGHAARKGAEILERMGFDGDVLLVAGDKVIEPRVIRRLLAAHQQSGAEATLATGARPPDSHAGILLKSPRGHIVGILEEAERQRLVAWGRLEEALRKGAALSRAAVEQIVGQCCRGKTALKVLDELWQGRGLEQPLDRAVFERVVPPAEQAGLLHVAGTTVPADQVLARFDQVNLSAYVFRAPVLYEVLQRLRAARPGQEEYLTDVFEMLARRRKPARVIGYEVEDLRELMAFNNPQELLAIEEACRQKAGRVLAESAPATGQALALPEAWEAMLQSPSPAVRRQFRQWYGDDIPWESFRRVLGAFVVRYGARQVALVRSPGRINLMGRHIDHQGGTVNVMAINREILVAAAPRADDQVSLANVNETQFSSQAFRLSDLVANLDWDDWQRVVDGPRVQRMLELVRGDWANYVKAAVLRLQELFRDRCLTGLDLMVGGDIPMGAGLSSSSALVVATAEAVTLFNHLPVSARRLVSLCGEGEWFVGTRGGAADHAAIKLCRRGYVTRVGFHPFEIGDSAAFFPGHDLVVCDSGLYAGKSHQVRSLFNAKVTAYHIGRVWCKMARPDLAAKIEHLRDLRPEKLGLDRPEFARLLCQLPAQITRPQVQAAFGQMAEADRDRLGRLFAAHESPARGYAVRDVVLFGLSEMARARRCLELLQAGDAPELGRLMNLSHDGDRVSRAAAANRWKRCDAGTAAAALGEWARASDSPAELADLTGAYGCSLPEIDRIVDLARRLPGVEGAQLAGAGLGGCVMALVQKGATAGVLRALADHGIKAEVFRPIAGACRVAMV